MPEDDREVTILVRRNGPYRVYGPAKLVDQDGNEFEIPPGDWFTLCRCGHSETKPFCDSTHKRVDFTPETCVRMEEGASTGGHLPRSPRKLT
jgi:CDGSH-type Zn-finger protein